MCVNVPAHERLESGPAGVRQEHLRERRAYIIGKTYLIRIDFGIDHILYLLNKIESVCPDGAFNIQYISVIFHCNQ